MARQKVKGTGHKQPADAKTEPNFYSMRPVEPVPTSLHKLSEEEQGLEEPQDQIESSAMTTTEYEAPHDFSSYTQHYEPNETTTTAPNYSDYHSSSTSFGAYARLPPVSFDSLSPASPGMTDAAQLLTGISQGYTGNLSIPMDTKLDGKMGGGSSDEGHQFLQPRLTSPSRRNLEPSNQEPV